MANRPGFTPIPGLPSTGSPPVAATSDGTPDEVPVLLVGAGASTRPTAAPSVQPPIPASVPMPVLSLPSVTSVLLSPPVALSALV
ncbi:hypothetical protein [Nocardioides alcanivorans]|uniref:hypothetical protein n=1 Tax=Nocardioides alcanivorans TaxID=2897352 RepID=UPI001F242DE2|nr:hypothetical protein [Nocardioides alcanivorans]